MTTNPNDQGVKERLWIKLIEYVSDYHMTDMKRKIGDDMSDVVEKHLDIIWDFFSKLLSKAKEEGRAEGRKDVVREIKMGVVKVIREGVEKQDKYLLKDIATYLDSLSQVKEDYGKTS